MTEVREGTGNIPAWHLGSEDRGEHQGVKATLVLVHVMQTGGPGSRAHGEGVQGLLPRAAPAQSSLPSQGSLFPSCSQSQQ